MPPDYYRQTTPYTCGPSSLMMARSHFEDDYTPTRADELAIWQATRTSDKYAYTTHPKLAQVLLEHGYQTELLHEHEEGFVHTNPMDEQMFTERMNHYNTFWQQSTKQGMRTRIQPLDAKKIHEYVNQPNHVAIILTKIDTSSIYFHHVLAYATQDQHILVANPSDGPQKITRQRLDELMDLPYGKGALHIWR